MSHLTDLGQPEKRTVLSVPNSATGQSAAARSGGPEPIQTAPESLQMNEFLRNEETQAATPTK